MDSIDADKPDRLVLLEEGTQGSDGQVELGGIIHREDVEVLQHLLDEVGLIVCDLLLGGVWTQTCAQIIFIVDMAHFLIELAGTEGSLDVEHHAGQLLAFRNLNGLWLPFFGLLFSIGLFVILAPLSGENGAQDEFLAHLPLANRVIEVKVQKLLLFESERIQQEVVDGLIAGRQREGDQRLHEIVEVVVILEVVHVPLGLHGVLFFFLDCRV